MKTALVIAVVVLVLLTGVPLGVMHASTCPLCNPHFSDVCIGIGGCAAVLVVVVLLVGTLQRRVTAW